MLRQHSYADSSSIQSSFYTSYSGLRSSIWGPIYWSFLTFTGVRMEAQESFLTFLYSIQSLLPCLICRNGFEKILQSSKNDTLRKKYKWGGWVMELHDQVNLKLNKSVYSLQQKQLDLDDYKNLNLCITFESKQNKTITAFYMESSILFVLYTIALNFPIEIDRNLARHREILEAIDSLLEHSKEWLPTWNSSCLLHMQKGIKNHAHPYIHTSWFHANRKGFFRAIHNALVPAVKARTYSNYYDVFPIDFYEEEEVMRETLEHILRSDS